ncbi:MAG: MFS transporter [Bacteroidota bacterium]
MQKTTIITRTIWILSLVSMFTDISSEMLYPVMPLYLKSIGFSIVLIGILEGVAEAVAGLSKGYFGKRSDAIGRRLPFVQLGYGLSALSKPLMAVSILPIWIFFARTTDRIGKGIRTGARDAMLSDETTPENKGKVFGFHRALDTLGAVIGPVVALTFLYFYPGQYKLMFLLAFIPGIVGIALTFVLKEKKSEQKNLLKPGFFSFLNYLKTSPIEYKKLLFGLLLFALFNSSDVFLLLMLREKGLSDVNVISVYIFYNLVYASFAYGMGSLGDKVGLKKTFILGLFLFAIVYGGMAVFKNLYIFYGLFFVYGVYAASTESIAKAWISNIADRKDTATAIGTHAAFNSIVTMLASSLAGIIWAAFGAEVMFAVSACAAVLVALYFGLMREEVLKTSN